MTSSWNHAVGDDGALREPEAVNGIIESGDVYGFAEEAYGMVWYLALHLAQTQGQEPAAWIEEARKRYAEGVAQSPTLER